MPGESMKHKSLAILLLTILNVSIGGAAYASYNGIWRSPLWPDNNTSPDAQGDCLGGNGGTKPDKCIWHEVSHDFSEGRASRVSTEYYNCHGTTTNSESASWSYSTSASVARETNSSSGWSLSGGFSDGVAATLGLDGQSGSSTTYTTGTTSTAMQTYTLNVPPGQKAWLTFVPKYRRSHGWLEVHYGSRMYGHFFWYYPYQGASNVTVLTPLTLPNGMADGDIKPVYVRC